MNNPSANLVQHQDELTGSTKKGVLTISASLLLVIALACVLGTARGVLFVAGGFATFSLPGLLLGLTLFGRKSFRCPEWTIFGAIFGIGLSSSAAVIIGYLFKWSPRTILLGIAVLTVLCACLARIVWNKPLLPMPRRWETFEYSLYAGIVGVITAFVAWPFLNVGKLTSHGYAYTWLFGYDFLVRGEYTLAMTRGFPPVSLPLAGEPLRMYLVGYALPAFVYSVSGKSVSLHAILLISSLGFNVLLYGSLFSLVRLFVPRRRALVSTIAVFLFGYSYYWIVSFAKEIFLNPARSTEFHRIGQSLVNFGNVSHLLTPIVMVEPQAVLGTCLLVFILFASELTDYNLQGYLLAICYGLALGITFGSDALWGLTAMLWFGVTYLFKAVRDKERFYRHFWRLTVSVVSCGFFCSVFFLAGMYQLKSGQEMALSPYIWLFKNAPDYFLIEFGPLLLLGVWGYCLEWKGNHSESRIGLGILALIALLQVAFLQVSVLPRTRMGVRMLPIVFLIGVAFLFTNMCERNSASRRVVVAWIIILLAVPTFFTDIWFTSNIDNINETHYVAVADRIACDWIRANLTENAVVQNEPQYLGYVGGHNNRQELYISLIADFAEREQVLGWEYIASEVTPQGKAIVEQRSKDLQSMLSASDPRTVLNVAKKYGIDYLYVGPYEQSLHPDLMATLLGTPGEFHRVYWNRGVAIFAVDNNYQTESAISSPIRPSLAK